MAKSLPPKTGSRPPIALATVKNFAPNGSTEGRRPTPPPTAMTLQTLPDAGAQEPVIKNAPAVNENPGAITVQVQLKSATGADMASINPLGLTLPAVRMVGQWQARALDHACAEFRTILSEIETMAGARTPGDMLMLQAEALQRGFTAYCSHLSDLTRAAQGTWQVD